MTGTSEKMLMNKLYKEYGLSPDHVFAHKHYKIITRAGVDKIQAAAKIEVEYDEVVTNIASETYWSQKSARGEQYNASLINAGDVNAAVVKAKAIRRDDKGEIIGKVTTYGEAYPSNCDNSYIFAMAEKRAMSRAVLKLAGLYEEGVFSEDEADDFGKAVKAGRANNVSYKGS